MRIEIEIPAPDDPAAAARELRARLAASVTAPAPDSRYERACARAEAALAVARIARELADCAEDEYAAAAAEVAACEQSPGIPLPRYQSPRPGTVPARITPDGKANR